MCGIGGMVDWRRGASSDVLRKIGEGMNAAQRHRGPDAEGVWIDVAAGVVLAHRRLSIIDISPSGAQPMHSRDGRYVILLNGEIYNYRQIRRELELDGRELQGNSDTEVLLEACARWGVRSAVERTIGMFAFALWDREARTLSLVRDRLGIKPLYYWADRNRVIFGSELKALRAVPDWTPTIDADSVVGFLRYGYIAQPRTIYREAAKLPPGHIATIRAGEEPMLDCFWDLQAIAANGTKASQPSIVDEREATERLNGLLRDAVSLHMIADVPLGAFLSGGIDSSAVVSLMQAQSARPVKTFSIGFREAAYDESQHARAIATHLGTDHSEFHLEPKDALQIIPKLQDWFDEPFADVSQIPTYLVAELTRRQVTVALSGDGGDECFAGYDRYFWAQRLAGFLCCIPTSMRRLSATALRSLTPERWNGVFNVVPRSWRLPRPGDRMHKLANIFELDGPDAIYRRLVSQWEEPQIVAARGSEPPSPIGDPKLSNVFPQLLSRMQYLDMMTYLPDDILTKVDRTTMAVSLEARVPLLDHRVVAFAWSLPTALKAQNGRGKLILRRVLERYVPLALIDRPKMGFGVPIDAWLRGPLREWAESLLSAPRLAADGLLHPAPIRKAWSEHLAGTRNWQYPLWTVLMFQAWRERWL